MHVLRDVINAAVVDGRSLDACRDDLVQVVLGPEVIQLHQAAFIDHELGAGASPVGEKVRWVVTGDGDKDLGLEVLMSGRVVHDDIFRVRFIEGRHDLAHGRLAELTTVVVHNTDFFLCPGDASAQCQNDHRQQKQVKSGLLVHFVMPP